LKYVLLALVLLFVFGCHKPVSPEASVIMLENVFGGGGTGFEVIAPSGKIYTLTNRHVCEALANNAVVDHRLVPLRIIDISNKTDLCLLEPLTGREALTVSQTPIMPHEDIFVWGYGHLQPLTRSLGEYVGPYSDTVLYVEHPDYCTAHILPGNSGSPVLNSEGDVIGVVFASGAIIDNRALCVPLKDIQEFLSVY